MSLVTALTATVVFGTGGVLHVRTEERELWSVAEAEMMLLARSVQVSAGNALRDHQVDDVVGQLRALERVEPDVDIFVYALDGSERTSGIPASDVGRDQRRAAAEAALRAGRDSVALTSDRAKGTLLAAAPLRDDEGRALGSLVVARPATRIQQDVRATRNSIIGAVLGFVVITSVMSFGLGELYVGRRLARLAEALRRAGAGDYDSRLEPGAQDEVGQVVEEFDRMAGQLAAARAELEARAEAQRQAERALQRADRLAAVGQLSAMVAHEIGSPLQIISGRARSLLKHAHDPKQTRRNVEILTKQTDRIVRITENLLAFARQNPQNFEWFEPIDAIREVMELVEIEARRCRVEMRVDAARGVPRILALRDQLQQAALNLIRNSLAACPPGGRIAIQLDPVTGAGGSPGVRIIVEDSGPGIPPEVLEHLFEPFFTTRPGTGGTGLGLTVVRSIVMEHGGTIRVESREQEGTRVTVWWPEVAIGSELVQTGG
jgi:signal transduction histidine kinase